MNIIQRLISLIEFAFERNNLYSLHKEVYNIRGDKNIYHDRNDHLLPFPPLPSSPPPPPPPPPEPPIPPESPELPPETEQTRPRCPNTVPERPDPLTRPPQFSLCPNERALLEPASVRVLLRLKYDVLLPETPRELNGFGVFRVRVAGLSIVVASCLILLTER